MTDDQLSLTLRGLAGDLAPLPDEVWERTLGAAFDPAAVVDADLVPEHDDLPVTARNDDLDLDLDNGIVLDDADHTDDYRGADAGTVDSDSGQGARHRDDSDCTDSGHIDSGAELGIDPGTGIGDTGPGESDLSGYLALGGHDGHPGDDLL
ncbi:hypothetical protein CH289_27080 [Rhodococcus sp. RS1C4]|nr:hypothetical protein [Rhodococcus sp. RS1C4]OZC42660.1 hypothetical protein CH289_27080 [Rhodococcus sp. RS1C4]